MISVALDINLLDTCMCFVLKVLLDRLPMASLTKDTQKHSFASNFIATIYIYKFITAYNKVYNNCGSPLMVRNMSAYA